MNAPKRTANPDETPDDAPAPSVSWSRLGRLGPALITVVALLGVPYLSPELTWARPWTPEDPVPFWNLIGRYLHAEETAEAEKRAKEAEDFAREALAQAENPITPVERDPKEIVELDEGDTLPEYVPQPGDDAPPRQSIELFTGRELDTFLESLAYSDAAVAGRITRVIHWGDSAIGMDGIPNAIRKRMQARFGNSGHGFHAIAPPNTSYLHRTVKFWTNEEWDLCFIIKNCKRDGRYGLGGVTAYGFLGAESRFRPNDKYGPADVDRYEIWYSGEPRGGRFKYRLDKGDWTEVDTKVEGDASVDGWTVVETGGGEHGLSVRAAGGGRTRMFGVTMERDVPGVVWDSAAMVGAFTKRMLNYDPGHLATQLEHRDSSLAVFTFGGNDMTLRISMEEYEKEYRQVLRMVKEAKPGISCLVMAPLDHGERKGVRIVSKPIVPEMVEAQRRAAKAEGCAFFDTYAAMGGEGSAGRWYRSEPRLMGGDLGHATGKGHAVIGEMVYRALLEAYVDYRKRER